MPQDAVLNTDKGYYDFALTADGQIDVDDFFDTAILYSILGEQRADGSEIPEPERQGGWIGNEFELVENGSKIWIHTRQGRLTRSVLNDIENAALNGLQWLVTDGFAESIDDPTTTINGSESVTLNVTIRRSESVVITRSFELWNNTGIR